MNAEYGNDEAWYELNFEALKDGVPNIFDSRAKGEPLWPERHSKKSLEAKRSLDPYIFETMYQGHPAPLTGLLYGDRFNTYSEIPSGIIKKGNYTDTADTGIDYLCSVCYDIDNKKDIYITDVVFTQEGMEITEKAVAEMLDRNQTRIAYIESNNGGRGFARNIGKAVAFAKVEWFFQSNNKESRILTNSSTVLKYVYMPDDWHLRWPEFYWNLVRYGRVFKKNKWHDAADVLTGIIEKEIVEKGNNIIKYARFH
ncbi:MAG: phage terminase large subunit [Rikenellaceae bacterium]|nr:phage terminase large subunit [Rikenellaceae bacterium]